MKFLLALFLSSAVIAKAQTAFTYPKLLADASDIANLTPSNWKLIDTAFGDLNSDKIDDVALVYQHNKPINEKRAYGDNDSEYISEYQRPRILAIYFKNQKTKKLHLSAQNNNFILREAEGGKLGEPLKEITIQNNVLKLFFEGGNDWRWKLNYQFKHDKNEWVLVRATNTYYNNFSGEMIDKNYDFVNRRLKLTTGSIFERNAANQITEETLFFNNLRTFKSFKKPWTWEITKDNFL